jgi:hypothetical protein
MVEIVARNGRSSQSARARKPASGTHKKETEPSDSESCAALQGQVAKQMLILRAEFHEAIACYSVRVQGLLAQAGDLLTDGVDGLDNGEQKRRSRMLRRVLDEMASLDLKPAKGRRRDLKAVEEFAAAVCAEIAEW